MKNIHLLPTEKPSRLWINNLLQGKLELSKEVLKGSNTAQHIYITSDEEIKLGDWYFNNTGSAIEKLNNRLPSGGYFCKKIILTTDQDLIKDGVQAIDNKFLEWFVKNPGCESVELKKGFEDGTAWGYNFLDYKIIIPKEEPNPFELPKALPDEVFYQSLEAKQETLEEAAVLSSKVHFERTICSDGFYKTYQVGFKEGAKWQAERMYSEDDLRKAFKHGILFKEESVSTCEEAIETEFSMLVEQFKKK
jgi:hypothetical protein